MATTIIKDTQLALIQVLKSGETGQVVSPSSIFYGTQLTREYPIVFVTWKGGPLEKVALGYENWVQDYSVISINSGQSGDAAEESVQDLAEHVIADVKANPTLQGKVSDCEVIRIDGQSATIGPDYGKTDRILAGSNVTVRVTLKLVTR
jgi:hypothetical protein